MRLFASLAACLQLSMDLSQALAGLLSAFGEADDAEREAAAGSGGDDHRNNDR